MSNRKDMIIHSIVGLTKKILNEIHCTKISQYFPKTYKPFGGDNNVKVDLSNYATQTDLKNSKGIPSKHLS